MIYLPQIKFMIKKIYSITIPLYLMVFHVNSQFVCGTDRFRSNIFSQITKTLNVQYGSNPNGTANLLLDVYEPTGDNLNKRPLIIFAHGGSFISGSKETDLAIVDLCERFCRMGYVTASINYTLGFDVFPPNPESAARTVYRSVHEMKAAIRFFRKDAATSNQFRIDPDNIFVGGSSAGAFVALHTAYLENISELPAGIDTTGLNGLEGICGNPGYSSDVKIVINLAGAIGDTAWMKGNTQPVVSVHGTNDNVVPYGSAIINFLGLYPVMEVDGSASIDLQADRLGIPHALLTFQGDGHVPYQTDANKMNQTANFVRDFIYDYMCNVSSILEELNGQSVSLWPVPVNDILHYNISTSGQNIRINILTLEGQVVKTLHPLPTGGSINISDLPAGFYFVSFSYSKGQKVQISKIIKL